MWLPQLELLLALSERCSLRAAADVLHVSQPALNKSRRQVEEEFGAQLVIRSSKGVRLAPAGELLAARGAVALRELARAREEVAWHNASRQASVAVGVSPAAASVLLPGALARYGARWPRVRVRVLDTLYPRAFAQLRTGELDLAVGPMPRDGDRRDIADQPLFTSRLVVVARRGHPLQRATRLAQLADARWVSTGPQGGPGDPAQLDLLPGGPQDRPSPVVCESFSTLLALARELDVLALMPQGFFSYFGRGMSLVALPLQDPLPATTVHALWRADTPLTLPARRLLDLLVQQAQGLPAHGESGGTGALRRGAPAP